jgi:TP901 family phage tail tape measure protein
MTTDTAVLAYSVTGQAQLAALNKQLERIQTLMFDLGKARDVSPITGTGFDKAGRAIGSVRDGIDEVGKSLRSVAPAAMEAGKAMDTVVSPTRAAGYESEINHVKSLNKQFYETKTRADAYANEMEHVANVNKTAAANVPLGQFEQFSQSLKTGLATAGTFAAKMAVLFAAFAAFRAVQAIIGGIIDGFKDLDTAARKVMSAMVVGGEANASYAGTFISLAYNAVKYRASVTEVGDATWELKSAGLSASEAMAGTGTALRLLTADVTDAGMTTRLLAGTYRVYKDELGSARTETEKFAYIGDVLALTLNRSQANMEGLVNGLKSSLAVAHAAGISFEVLMASLSVLNNQMMLGSMAGTGLRGGMSQISQDLDDIVERYGLVVDKGKSMGSQLLPILEQLHEKVQTGSLSIEEMAFWFKTSGLRGSQAILALVQNYDELRATIEAYSMEAAGSLEAMSNIRMQSLTENIDASKTALKSFGAMAAGPALNGINELSSGLNDLMAELIRYAGIEATLDVKLTMNGDYIEKLSTWKRLFADFGNMFAGMVLPGSGLLSGSIGDMAKMASGPLADLNTWLEKTLGITRETGDSFESMYDKMSEAGKTTWIEALVGDVGMLDIKLAEGTASNEDYAAALAAMEDRLLSVRDEINKTSAAYEDAAKNQDKDAAEEYGKKLSELENTYSSLRKEIAETKKEMGDMYDLIDNRSFALDTLFDLGEISKADYTAGLAEGVNAVIAEANRLAAAMPGSKEAMEAMEKAKRKIDEYGSKIEKDRNAMASLADEQKRLASEAVAASVGMIGNIETKDPAAIRDRIRMLEDMKKALSEPGDIIEVDKQIGNLLNTLAGLGVNVGYDMTKIMKEMGSLKAIADPLADTKNTLAGINAGELATFKGNLEGVKNQTLPDINKLVAVDLSAGFGVARDSVGRMNSELNETIKKVNIINGLLRMQQGLSGAGQGNVVTTGNSVNQQVKLGL